MAILGIRRGLIIVSSFRMVSVVLFGFLYDFFSFTFGSFFIRGLCFSRRLWRRCIVVLNVEKRGALSKSVGCVGK